MTTLKHTCLDVEQIEGYLLQHLDEPEIAAIEERLLVCEHCREVYSHVEAFVDEIRCAMSLAPDEPGQPAVVQKTAAS